MEWIYVVIAGLLEVLSINYMNKWQLVKHLGLKKSGILIIKMVLAFATSLLLLNLALKTLPMSITYADEHYICSMVRNWFSRWCFGGNYSLW